MRRHRKQAITDDQSRIKALTYLRGKAVSKGGVGALVALRLLRTTVWLSHSSSFCSVWTQPPSLLSKAIAMETPNDLNQGRTSY